MPTVIRVARTADPAGRFLPMSGQLPDRGTELSPADIEALDAQWSLSWTPSEIAQRLAGIPTPWYVAAGWALDLFRGRQTRQHADIEIAIPAARFPEVL